MKTDICVDILMPVGEKGGVENVVGKTAIESLASGIPVISTPVDGITELIKPGINGFLYNFGDSDGLADILDLSAFSRLFKK